MFLASVAGTPAVIVLTIRHKLRSLTSYRGRLSVCPGQTFAEAFLWVTMATLLSSVSMRGSLDQVGKEIYPEERFQGTVTRYVADHPLFKTSWI